MTSMTDAMVTRPLFQEDAYLQTCKATVLSVTSDGVVLDQTVFYPLGGGQPGDRGYLQRADGTRIDIVDTRKGDGGRILHIAADPAMVMLDANETISAHLDWNRRYRHMRMHTCLHLLGAVLPYGVTGGNIGAEKSRLDFDMADIPDKEDINDKLNKLIAGDHPVATQWITAAELDAKPELIRTMSVQPPRGAGRIRLLEIPGIDLQPCGGTHVRRSGEIGCARISKIEKKGKHNRRVYIVITEG